MRNQSKLASLGRPMEHGTKVPALLEREVFGRIGPGRRSRTAAGRRPRARDDADPVPSASARGLRRRGPGGCTWALWIRRRPHQILPPWGRSGASPRRRATRALHSPRPGRRTPAAVVGARPAGQRGPIRRSPPSFSR
jgi:hypothetical protein